MQVANESINNAEEHPMNCAVTLIQNQKTAMFLMVAKPATSLPPKNLTTYHQSYGNLYPLPEAI
jgi:hypothetical protein